MKRALLALLVLAALLCGCIGGDEDDNGLTIYTYDSFVAEWGPGPVVFSAFEQAYGAELTVVSMGSSGEMLTRAIAEKDDPQADVLLGINDLQMYRAFEAGLLEEYIPQGHDSIPDSLVMDTEWRITPFDYGYMAIIYDSEAVSAPPQSFEDLRDERWEDSLIVEDPRTSSPGLSFLLWTIAVYGEQFDQYWEDISDSLLTVAPSWSTAYYGMFMEGEAPCVVSYSSSPAYHLAFEQTQRYKGVIMDEGAFVQIEGAGIVSGTGNQSLAEEFIDFMLTDDFQGELALTQFMLPVIPGTELPDSYSIVETSDNILEFDRSLIGENLDQWVQRWLEAIGGQ